MRLTRPAAKIPVILLLLAMQAPAFALDYYQQQLQYQDMLKRQREQIKQQESARYRQQVGDKALNGAVNILSAPLEFPKNVINLTNEPESNIFFGLVGGAIRGSIDAAGRISNGLADLLTAPIPTKKVVYPHYVWDDFDQYNTYGRVMRLVDNPPITAPEIPPPHPISAVRPAAPDPTDRYRQETNSRLDSMFQKEMMK